MKIKANLDTLVADMPNKCNMFSRLSPQVIISNYE